jgi:type VI protein secretion system component Hcp
MLTRECADMKYRMLPALIVAACLGAMPAMASADTFLLVQGVAGDATSKGHEAWIRVTDFNWEVEAESSWTQAGGGASVGKPNPGKFTFTIPEGTWSREFMYRIGTGTAIPKVMLDHYASDGRPVLRVTMENFFITKYKIGAPANEPTLDHVEGVFKTLRLEYFTVDSTGKLTTTGVDWNVSALSIGKIN